MIGYNQLAQSVLKGDENETVSLVQQLLGGGTPPIEILHEGLIAGMNEVGKLFRDGELFLPEVLMAADAMKSGIALIQPLLGDMKPDTLGTIVLGTVKGDLHDIGKNIVGMMLETAGFEVINLGYDVSPKVFADKVRETGADIMGMSSLLTTSMIQMDETIKLLKAEGLREGVKVVIGGAPTSKEFSDRIGADGFSADALAAVDLCKNLMAAKA